MNKLYIAPLALLFSALSSFQIANPKKGDRNSRPASNPFSTASKLPYQAPPFDKIKNSDYKPAVRPACIDQLF